MQLCNRKHEARVGTPPEYRVAAVFVIPREHALQIRGKNKFRRYRICVPEQTVPAFSTVGKARKVEIIAKTVSAEFFSAVIFHQASGSRGCADLFPSELLCLKRQTLFLFHRRVF